MSYQRHNVDQHPLVRVINHRDLTCKYNRPGEGSREHFLECGHSVITKQSQGFAKRKRCRECGQKKS